MNLFTHHLNLNFEEIKSWYLIQALVTMNNFQMYRHIPSPGWTVGWQWQKKEVIWSIVGAQATEQGDCSKFKGNVPHCCKRTPIVVDLLPGVPYNQQIANCCKAGVVSSYGQDPEGAVSAFQVSVGLSGTSNKTVKLPKNFVLLGPSPGYSCGPAIIVPSTVYLTPDHRRKTQALSKQYYVLSYSCSFWICLIWKNFAYIVKKIRQYLDSAISNITYQTCFWYLSNIQLRDHTVLDLFSAVTWNVTCTYSQFLSSKYPSCCVSFSSFYNSTITPCPSCSCGCHGKKDCIKWAIVSISKCKFYD